MSLRNIINPRLLGLVPQYDLLQASKPSYNTVRLASKHWNPKFKKLRAAKFIKVELPDFEAMKKPMDQLSDDEIRSKLKEKGLLPEYAHNEKPIFISSTGDVFEPYVPPEGDGKVSKITKEGAKQTWEFVEKKGKSYLAVRKIRSFDEDFEIADFLPHVQDIYIKAHEAIAAKDKDLIQQYVTEKAYPEVFHNTDKKTIHWHFIKSIEPPRVVHARCTSIITKDNVFGQITVRLHTQQVLAVYDRFGRLMFGSEILSKDVLEYVVFEKHLSYRYGVWRIHSKIIPDWKPASDVGTTTFVVKREPKQELKREDSDEIIKPKQEEIPVIPETGTSRTPAFA